MSADVFLLYNSSLASPDSETTPNNIVLVTHSAAEDLRRIEELKISASTHFRGINESRADTSHRQNCRIMSLWLM